MYCLAALQVRSVRSVTSVCQDRALSLAAHIAAKHDLDAKKVRCFSDSSVVLLWGDEVDRAGHLESGAPANV